ncbi:hypothetical protein MCOR23_009299 [Pyricularia oryzae]|nr:hypothetical protein MCOR23_009299 [Pyricularia oryzae]
MLYIFRRHALAPTQSLACKRGIVKYGLPGTAKAHGLCPPRRRHLSEMTASAHKYPGLHLPLRYLPQDDGGYAISIPKAGSGPRINPYFVREVAMMLIMEQLTDKQGWERKVFDQAIVDKWRKEALAIPDEQWWREIAQNAEDLEAPAGIINESAFDYCIKELMEKAKYFSETGVIPGLDLAASVAKSDTLIDEDLKLELRSAVQELKAHQASSPDWHPRSNDTVQDLVHPSLYPLVYGRSRVFGDEVVGIEDAVEKWAGKGEIITAKKGEMKTWDIEYDLREFWSDTYQWLPSNLSFQDDGSLRFTSYINNLHPKRYAGIYRTLEKLIAKALPLWEQCLIMADDSHPGCEHCPGKRAARIPKSANPDDSHLQNWIPSDVTEVADSDVDPKLLEDEKWVEDNLLPKWASLRKPVHPEPSPFLAQCYKVHDEMRLANKFAKSGLQVIIKIASIELTPEHSKFAAGSWHVEGQLNERICATALYYLDSDNITESSLSFEMQTDSYIDREPGFRVDQDSYNWLESVIGANLGVGNASACLQACGTVTTGQGRLLAFPNTLQHAVSPFELKDKTKPGHRRFVALWLVDPHVRIISTAKVPPQQQSWWVESILNKSPAEREAAVAQLPEEILESLREAGVFDCDDQPTTDRNGQGKAATLPEEVARIMYDHAATKGLMSEAEAHDHRLELMNERTRVENHEERFSSYCFCEH